MTTASTSHVFTMTEKHANLIFTQISSHCQSLKNWMATAIETGDLDRAKEMVRELREYETLFASFNMAAKRDIAKHRGSEMPVEHVVR